MFNKLTAYNIILGSGSPRRREILAEAGVDFHVRVLPDIDESYPADLPCEEVSAFISRKKADAWTGALGANDIVITSDTTVWIDDTVLGKPADAADAARMLEMLSGRTHHVTTGVTILSQTKRVTFSDTTSVTFKPLSAAEIDYYITHFRPFDKAGAYGIQEWIGMVGVSTIEGSFYNVMGLPIHRLIAELLSFCN